MPTIFTRKRITMLPVANSAGLSPKLLHIDFSCKQFMNSAHENSLFSPSIENSDGEDLDCEFDSMDDSDLDALYSSSDESEEPESADSQKAESSVPFWFSFEEPSHIERIVKAYAQQYLLRERGECRRLPNFVGRIERQPVFSENEFTTLDTVQIYRRDIRQVGSAVSLMEERLILTKWDQDGLPSSFQDLQYHRDVDFWKQRIIFEQHPSFIYALPVWCSNADFYYKVTPDRRDVGYAKEPFNFTKYIPPHYLPPTSDEHIT